MGRNEVITTVCTSMMKTLLDMAWSGPRVPDMAKVEAGGIGRGKDESEEGEEDPPSCHPPPSCYRVSESTAD